MHDESKTREQLLSELHELRQRVSEWGRDRAERKQAVRSLIGARNYLRTILQAIPDGFFVCDAEGRITKANEAYCRMSGYSVSELLLLNIADIDAAEEPSADVVRAKLSTGEGPVTFETRHQRKDGSLFDVEVSATYLDLGRGRTVCFCRDITERKRAEAALAESEQRFSLAIEATRAGLWDWNTDTDEVYYSPGYLAMLGYEPGELPAHVSTWADRIHPEDREAVLKANRDSIENRCDHFQVQFRMQAKNGEWRWILGRGKPAARDENGRALRMIGTHTDITGHKRAERALIESESKFKSFAEKAFTGIYIIQDEVFKYVNPTFAQMFGYTVEECLNGMPFKNLVCAADLAAVEEQIGRQVSGEDEAVCYTFRGLKKNGQIFPVEIYGSVIVYQGRPAATGTILDITQRKQLEEFAHLRLTLFEFSGSHSLEELIQKTMDEVCSLTDSPIGFYFFVEDDQTTLSLQAWSTRTLKEFCKAEWKGAHYPVARAGVWADCVRERRPVIHNDYPALPHRTGMPEGHVEVRRELVVPIIRSGRIVAILGIGNKPADYTENDVDSVCYLADMAWEITQRKRAEEERAVLEAENRQLQKAESLGRMAGAIAHLFNNQLTVVMGNLELALTGLTEEVAIREKLVRAMRAARRSSEISGLMLDYLGQTSDKGEPLDLSDICRLNLPTLLDVVPEGVAIETDLLSSGPLVLASANQMKQVLTNLATNGWESMEHNAGTITIATKIVSASEITKSHLAPIGWKPAAERYSCLEFRDTGCGMVEDDLDKIFDPFFTTKFIGRGLGLAVVLGIVKACGGAIGVESQKHQGSIFRVFLPLVSDGLHSESEKAIEVHRVQHGGVVLLVEDQDMVRAMTELMLKQLGYEVLGAPGGAEAVQLFQQNPDRVRFVVTDLTMAGMDGWETLSVLREIRPNIPAILVSGYNEAYAMGRDGSGQSSVFLHKPYSMSDLRSAIGSALKKPVRTG